MNINDTNTLLTDKEKKIKKTEARRRAILWSERKICKRQMKQTQKGVQTINISDHTESHTPVSRNSEVETLSNQLLYKMYSLQSSKEHKGSQDAETST